MFSTFAVVGDGKKEGIKCFFKACLVIVCRLTVDGNELISRIAEVGQDVFLGHFGDGGKEAGVEPDVERALV